MTTIKPNTETVVIYQGDDAAALADLRVGVQEAAVLAAGPRRLGDSPSLVAAAEEYDTFKDAAVKRGVHVTVQHMNWRQWRTLTLAHPPREENEEDHGYGFNLDEMMVDEGAVLPSIIEVTSPTKRNIPDVGTQAFIDALPERDFRRVFDAVVRVNQGGSPDPKESSLASRLAQISDDTSGSPDTTD